MNRSEFQMFVRAYLRASSDQQDAQRARASLQAFVDEKGLKIPTWYAENESGASLKRPELFRLINDSQPGDLLICEQVDRISRLTTADWNKLKDEIAAKKIRIVALDLLTSWIMVNADENDFTSRIFEGINSMLLDMLAAVGRKDYEDRRRRQAQGQAKAKAKA
jgi:DNA invertase Pin-like site-specific DNA recombinase